MNELKEKFGKKETNLETIENGETMDNGGVPAKVKKESIFAKAWSGIKKFLNKEFTVKQLLSYLLGIGLAVGTVFKIIVSLRSGGSVDDIQDLVENDDGDYTDADWEVIQDSETEMPVTEEEFTENA